MTKKLLMLCLSIANLCCKSQNPINPFFFGNNYWLTTYNGAPLKSITTLNSTQWGYLQESGAKMVRVGGNGYNNNTGVAYKVPLEGGNIVPAGYVKIVDDLREKGFEPIITVPLRDDGKRTISAQADTAAEIVRMLNVVHKRNVKYFVIANEPGIDQGYYDTDGNDPDLDDLRRIRDYIKEFSVKMKLVDPDIIIIGPELEYNWDTKILDYLCTASTNSFSIMGTIGTSYNGINTSSISTKYFIDRLSYHIYPGYVWGAGDVRTSYVNEGYNFASNCASTYTKYINKSGHYNRTGNLKIVIDEFHVANISNTLTASTSTAISNESINGNTFLSGQLIVDMMAGMLAAKESTNNICPFDFSNLWSVDESSSHGFLDGTVRKPAYWHYQLMAKYFKGDFYSNIKSPPYSSGNVNRCFKAYACKNRDYIAVIIMNQAQTSNVVAATQYTPGAYTFSLNFNGGSSDHAFSMNTGWTADYNVSLNNKSTAVLFFNCTNTVSASSAYLGKILVEEGPLAADASTFTPVQTGTIPSTPTSPTTAVCAGASNGTLTAPSATTYTWISVPSNSVVSNSSSYTAAGPGIYKLGLTGGGTYGCGETWITSIINGTSPIISPAVLTALRCVGTTTAQLTVSVTPGATVAWTPTTNISASTGTNVQAYPTATTNYVASVTQSGCTVSETLTVLASKTYSLQDAWARDDASDVGNEVNSETANGSNNFHDSPDIWITYNGTSTTHTNAEYKTDGSPNYVHVRVRNRGNEPTTANVNVYWSKSSTGIAWPLHWNNWVNTGNSISTLYPNVSYGDQIGTTSVVTVPSSTSTPNYKDLVIPWYPPNPNIYPNPTYSMNACVLVRIETGCGMAFTEGVGVNANAYRNNDVVYKNLTIVDNDQNNIPPLGAVYGLILRNIESTSKTLKFEFDAPDNGNNDNFFDYGHAYMHVPDALYDKWVTGGELGTGIVAVDENTFKFTQDGATLEGLSFNGNEEIEVGIRYTYNTEPPADSTFVVDIEEINTSVPGGEFVGGQRYLIHPTDCPTVAVQTSTLQVDEGCEAALRVANSSTAIAYTWYEQGGSSVGTGSLVLVYPTVTTIYEVEAARNGCIALATMTVEVVDVPGSCGGKTAPQVSAGTIYTPNLLKLVPNPTNEITNVTYSLRAGEKAELIVTNGYGQTVYKTDLNSRENTVQLDCGNFKPGLYYVSVKSSGKIISSAKLGVIR